MTQFEPENLTENQVIALLQMLFTNLNQVDAIYYDLFINPIPMDVTLERYDENGTLKTIIIPNRAKDKLNMLSGVGSPEGSVEGNMGTLYFDTRGRELYYKSTATSLYGWSKILSAINFREGIDFLKPDGEGFGLQNLNGTNITGGVVQPSVGGTGSTGITGIVKGQGSYSPYTVAVPDVDYMVPTSYVGMIGWFAGITAPSGWLIADGHEESRIERARLFERIGVIYGAGDGQTTFNVPNLISRFPEGATEGIGTYIDAGLPPVGVSTVVTGGSNKWGDAAPAANEMGYFIGSLYTANIGTSEIYGRSTTVQPASVLLLPCIKY